MEWFSQPYRRLPGFGDPERGDAVVFNFPEGDTVVANFQNQSYYQLVRDHGRAKIHDPNFRMLNMVNGQVRRSPHRRYPGASLGQEGELHQALRGRCRRFVGGARMAWCT